MSTAHRRVHAAKFKPTAADKFEKVKEGEKTLSAMVRNAYLMCETISAWEKFMQARNCSGSKHGCYSFTSARRDDLNSLRLIVGECNHRTNEEKKLHNRKLNWIWNLKFDLNFDFHSRCRPKKKTVHFSCARNGYAYSYGGILTHSHARSESIN